MPSTISAGTTAGTAIAITGDTTGNLAFQTNGTTTAMTIDTSQNVGIGTTSPGTKLDVVGGTIRSTVSGGTPIVYLNNGSSQHSIQNNSGVLGLFNDGTNVANLTNTGLFQFNSGYGSVATAYGCRAWVNFNGTGTVAIRASGNVSSITDLGTGQYQVNFSNAMPDANYSTTFALQYQSGVNWIDGWGMGDVTTTSVKIAAYEGGYYDMFGVNVAIFR